LKGASPWWTPGRHVDRRPFLVDRSRIKAALRHWFEGQGFIEVETAALQVSPGNETHLHAFSTDLIGTDLAHSRLYLHTSPEFACKKLLAAGESRIFTFAPVYRNRERGPLHHPEFTMLEWYRTGAPYEQLWEDCAEIVRIASAITGRTEWSYGGRSCNSGEELATITVAEAFVRHGGIPLLETCSEDGVDLARMRAYADQSGVRLADDDTWSDVFSRVVTERVQPNLGLGRPEILCEYPAHEAALARKRKDDLRLSERFELFACGVELANGFGELTDPVEQRRRFEIEMAEKQRIYGDRYPLDEDLLAALAHMPAAAGCALGFDRLVMLATGATDIEQVIWTPVVST